jgi:hypothetical protein
MSKKIWHVKMFKLALFGMNRVKTMLSVIDVHVKYFQFALVPRIKIVIIVDFL